MHTDAPDGIRMEASACRAFLAERGHGMLSLADDGESYAFPVSYGYDEDAGLFLYLLEFGSGGTKFEYVEPTERATLTAYEVVEPGDWRSVVVTGSLREFADERTGTELTERAVVRSVMEDSAWFPTFDVEADGLTGQRTYLLSVDEPTGRTASGE